MIDTKRIILKNVESVCGEKIQSLKVLEEVL